MQQHEHELFPLQALVKRNHLVTPISQSVKLYSIDVKLTHEADGVRLVLSPVDPILQHSSFGTAPEGCTGHDYLLTFGGKTHEENMLFDNASDTLVVHVGTNNVSSFLETLAGVAQYFHAMHEYMARAVNRAVGGFVDYSMVFASDDARAEGGETRRRDER